MSKNVRYGWLRKVQGKRDWYDIGRKQAGGKEEEETGKTCRRKEGRDAETRNEGRKENENEKSKEQ